MIYIWAGQGGIPRVERDGEGLRLIVGESSVKLDYATVQKIVSEFPALAATRAARLADTDDHERETKHLRAVD